MKIDLSQGALVVLVFGGLAGGWVLGLSYPLALLDLADHLITLLSVLVGVSLALSAVFASPLTFGSSSGVGSAEADRIKRTVSEIEGPLSVGLVVIYYVMLLAIVGLIALLFFESDSAPALEEATIQKFSAMVGSVAGGALALALRLPLLLARSATLRNW